MNPSWIGMFPQPMQQTNLWQNQQIFLQFQMFLTQSQTPFDTLNQQMQFNYFQQFIRMNGNPLAFQPLQMQNQVFQQFLMWRQSQQMPKPNQSNNGNGNNKGVLKRDKITETMNLGSGGLIINITMTASTGHKVVIQASADSTIEELLLKYVQKMGLSPDSVGRDIMFLFNGAKLDPHSKEKLGSRFCKIGRAHV